jgi:hypothetical protein
MPYVYVGSGMTSFNAVIGNHDPTLGGKATMTGEEGNRKSKERKKGRMRWKGGCTKLRKEKEKRKREGERRGKDVKEGWEGKEGGGNEERKRYGGKGGKAAGKEAEFQPVQILKTRHQRGRPNDNNNNRTTLTKKQDRATVTRRGAISM